MLMCTRVQILIKMGSKSILRPPNHVRNMIRLDKDLFRKSVSVFGVEIDRTLIKVAQPVLKKYFLKLPNSKLLYEQLSNVTVANRKLFLFDPNLITDWKDLESSDRIGFSELGITRDRFRSFNVHLQFDNYSLNEILKAILPDVSVLSSFTQVGHLVHINLKDHLVAHRHIIGEVILAKIANCKTVVYKSRIINNTYRNFEMEILCGEPNTVVKIKNRRCTFEFDFAKVYWNSRLETEHERIVNMLEKDDVLYDVFAGVGPFAIPAAKKGCYVLANDLNPDAFRWLTHNCKLNKVQMQLFNKDGADFIKSDLKHDLVARCNRPQRVHVVMNLPAMAVEFLPNFRGLLRNLSNVAVELVCHVYCFIKAKFNYESLARDLVENHLNYSLKDEHLLETLLVRTVSNYKEMVRISFKIDSVFLLSSDDVSVRKRSSQTSDHGCQPFNKKVC